MRYYKEMDMDEYLELEVGKCIHRTKEGFVEYYNVEAGFDIETTSYTTEEGEKVAFMYIWMLGIGFDNEVIYGRTWDEFKDCIETISEILDLTDENRLVVYVHNLSYEFQFMRKYFDWLNVFAVDERKPIKALTVDGIEFRDSYILSGKSLALTAKNLTKYPVKKLEGNLDYSLIRTYETTLTDDELAYCENDVRVVLSYIKEELEFYGDLIRLPLTNTGRVRKYVKDQCYFNNKNHKKSSQGKYKRYRDLMLDLTLSPDIYKQLKRAFMGGFTHASNLHSHRLLEGVDSIDLTSSYPTVMVAEKFPMSRAKPLEARSVEELEELAKTYCLVFDARFEGITNSLGYESYISENRCKVKGEILDNGRVYYADELIATITEVDFDIMKHVYDWDSLRIKNLHGFYKGRLPKPIIKSILQLYEEKTRLKGIEGYEAEYLLSKGMLNSIYGMSVTDVLQDNHEYERGNWVEKPIDIEEAIETYNQSKNRFLYYPWGVWVTAYARRNVWSAILNIGEDYVYCDTDSIKMLNYDNNLDYISAYNENIQNKLVEAVNELGLEEEKLYPENKDGEKKPLGIWEHEGFYDYFKTLGAKRYMYYEKGQYHLVVAGLSKTKGMEYIKRVCNNDPERIFAMFNDELYVPAHETGKMTHTYIDEPKELEVVDYQGNRTYIETKSGVHLEPCEFTLSVSSQYVRFLEQLKKGYIYKGVKYT